jgi:hypothetical protein
MLSATHLAHTMLILDIIAHLRHGDCGGGAGRWNCLPASRVSATGQWGSKRLAFGVAVAVMIGLAALPGWQPNSTEARSPLRSATRQSGAEMRTASNREAVNNALTKPLDTRPRKDILRFCDPTSQNFLASETTIADSADRTLVVDRRSAVGTSLPQAASKRALPAKTRQ